MNSIIIQAEGQYFALDERSLTLSSPFSLLTKSVIADSHSSSIGSFSQVLMYKPLLTSVLVIQWQLLRFLCFYISCC